MADFSAKGCRKDNVASSDRSVLLRQLSVRFVVLFAGLCDQGVFLTCVCRLCDRSFQFVLVLFVCLNRSGVFCTVCAVGVSNLLKQIVFVCLFE